MIASAASAIKEAGLASDFGRGSSHGSVQPNPKLCLIPFLLGKALLRLLDRPQVAKSWSTEAVYEFAVGGDGGSTRPRRAEGGLISIAGQSHYGNSGSAEVLDLGELLDI